MQSVIINVVTSPKGGGAELLVKELARRIPLAGMESYAVYFNVEDGYELADNEFVLAVPSRSPLAIVRLRKIIKMICRGGRGVVVHSHLTWPFYYVALACIGLPVKLVFTEHNTTNRRRGMAVFRKIDSFFYNRYDRVVCISQGVHASLKDWFSSGKAPPMEVISNGARIFDFHVRGVSKSQVKLISIGSLTKQKGFDVAIKAVSLISDSVREYFIVGEGDDREYLSELICGLGLESKIKLLGWTDELQELLHAADIQLIPSEWEGFGLVAVEGMSTGLPVIASDVSGLREVVSAETNIGALLVQDHRNPETWAQRILELIETMQVKGPSLANAARSQAEKFSLSEMTEGYIQLYENL